MSRPPLLKFLFAVLTVLFLNLSRAQAQLDQLTAWRINTTGAKGHSTDATINGYVSNYTADVKSVWFASDYVYVNSSGVPSYDVGPFPDGNPSYPSDRNWQVRFTRDPQAATGTHTATGLGSIGLLVNGVPLYNPKDAHSYNNQNVWYNNAVVVEAPGFDAALGHPSPVQGTGNPPAGAYHHHQVSPSLSAQLGGISASAVSPLMGFAFDGFPIYGPYGYAYADGSGGVTRMTSSYRLRSITQRHTLADGTNLSSTQWGPDVSTTYPLGYFIQDYEYVSGLGLLDQYNGRFTVTPEYPNGTYAYFGTIDANGANAYPYYVGPSYYGVLDTSDLTGNVTIPGTALRYRPGDFNGSTAVDAADYVTMRQQAGTQSDYNTWRTNFGTAYGSGDGAISEIAVPEPSCLASLLGGSGIMIACRRLRRV